MKYYTVFYTQALAMPYNPVIGCVREIELQNNETLREALIREQIDPCGIIGCIAGQHLLEFPE